MTDSLHAFMENIIDYAGLFPPADLPMEASIRNYAEYRNTDDAWMLSRFIIPWDRLTELKNYREELNEEGPPYDFSVLGSKKDTVPDFLLMMEALSESLRIVHEEHGRRMTTGMLEIKLPDEAAFSHNEELIREVMDETAGRLNEASPTVPGWVFYESYFEKSWKKDIEAAVEAIIQHNEKGSGDPKAGLKIRCGGVRAEQFPTLEQLSYTLITARDSGVPVKCTAGLHHPVRIYHDSVQTKMHGFLNVFGGGMLAHVHGLGSDELTEILREEDPEAFAFTGEGFSWGERSVPTEEIRRLRSHALISFGSCSFDEPREDLRKLGHL
ncbi:MAG: hypothetical protein R3224_04485 [Balneolaceae bacterium]|nr:hypothetical protein [Balneolaceae bacterium]